MERVPGVLAIDGDAVGGLRYQWRLGGNVLGGVLELEGARSRALLDPMGSRESVEPMWRWAQWGHGGNGSIGSNGGNSSNGGQGSNGVIGAAL